MNRLILIIICLYLLFSPFYFFPSGMPQVADFIIALGSIIFVFDNRARKTITLPIFKYVFRLLILIILINFIYWFIIYVFQGTANRMIFVPLYYLFNILFMAMFAYTQITKQSNKNINIIALFVVFSLSIQFVLALLGLHGGAKDIESRLTLYFNNPNQLGYFTLSMLTVFFVLPNKYKKNILVIIYIVAISSFLIFYSGSRAALAGILLLSAYTIYYKESFKLKLKSILLLVAVIIATPLFIQTTFVQKQIKLMQIRNERYVGSNVTQAQIRGYDRILLNPEYIFFGAGEGKNDRFESYHQLEIHSAFGTMLFSYGILGFLMFLHLIYFVSKKNLFHSFILLLPILVYNITHNGLRNSLLWAILISIYIANERK